MDRAKKSPSKPSDPIAVTPTVTSTVEREIKLAVDDHFRLPVLPGTPLPRHLLTSTYYDTAQYHLAHVGITLRRRVERGKQAWQLKLPLMKDRQEVELVGPPSIPPAMFRDLLFLPLGQRELMPVATLRVWRAGIRVRMDHAPVADVTIDQVSVMIVAVVISVLIMMLAAEPISAFVHRHPTVKMLALSFLLLIGFTLVGEACGMHIPKGYVYFAMGFSVMVEFLNLKLRKSGKPVDLNGPELPLT